MKSEQIVPLHSAEAEQGVLGCVMLAWDKTLDLAIGKYKLKPESFYVPAHRIVWTGILELSKLARGIDVLTVSDWCATNGHLDAIGGRLGLNKLIEATPTETHAEYYMGIVRDKAMLRMAIEQCREAIGDAYTAADATEFVSKLPGRFLDGYVSDQDERPNGDLMAASIERWRLAAETKKPAIGLMTPWSKLTYQMSGFEVGLTILAGRPSAGKTTMEDQICCYLALSKHPVARVTLDSSREELLERAVCRKAGVSLPKLKFGFGRKDQLANASGAAADLDVAPIYINDRDRDISAISAYARAMKRRHGIELLTVDYIQLIRAEEMGRSEWDTVARVTYISMKLKALSFELGIPVLVLSQLSRGVEKEDREPMLSDLRDTGAIEQDASKVIFLYVDGKKKKEMEEAEPKATKHKRPVVVNVMKHKNGSTGALPFWLYPPYFNFEPAATDTISGKLMTFVDDDLPMSRHEDKDDWKQVPDYLPLEDGESDES